MSKRPKQANAVMSRLRRPVGRLRDLPIWSKLGLIMLVPTLATVVVGVNGLVDHIQQANSAEQTRTLSVLSQASGNLVDHLQNERTYGVMITTTKKGSGARKAATASYNAEHAAVDAAKVPYSQQRATLSGLPTNVNTLLSRLDNNLGDLPATRSAVANVTLKTQDVIDFYTSLIDDLLNVRDSAAQLTTDVSLSNHLRAVAAVARAKEYIAEQRDVGHQILQAGQLTVQLRRDYTLTDTGYNISLDQLAQVGTSDEQLLFKKVVSGPLADAATNLTTPLFNLEGANTKLIPFTSDSWETALTNYNGLFRAVERRFDTDIVAEATSLRDNTNRQVFIETSVLLLLLLIAIVFAWLVARSMARSLRELRQGALSVAQYGLPQAVERLRDPSLIGSLTPAQVADQVAEPLPVRSRDEFGQVTEAFNAVHLEAVRTAAEQAALRASVATMFVNLARRSQILVDRLIGHLDRLERGEEDPDRLAELFQLDHLATRMRRNDENLLVLAGADSTRVQREPAALIDVLRAAQSEVEHYTRIEFGMIDRDIEVGAHAVNDMVHLVAELFDNATAFSPPNSTVLVEARRLGDSAVLSVEDRGIGISREQLRDLNERLANPPLVDVAVSRMMGLVVVARLATRHGVSVELRPADTERGTVADVGLPIGVLVLHSAAGRLAPGSQQTFGNGGMQQQPLQSQRPPFGEPLALESGNGGFGGRPFDPNPPMPTGGMLGTNGRSVPAWSDLTVAPGNGFANGSNGSNTNGSNGGLNGNGSNGSNGNGFRGPRSNEPIPPIPQSPGPQGMGQQGMGQQGLSQQGPGPQSFAGPDGLPQRRNGDSPAGDANGFSIPRQLPSNPEHQSRPPFVPPVSAPPSSAPPFGGRPVSSLPVSGPPVSTPPASAPPAQSAPAQPAPPAWPPVAADRNGSGTPAVPESLAASLDMTAEIPRYRPDRSTDAPSRANGTDRPADVDRSAAAAAAAHEVATQQAAAAQATAAQQIAAAQAAARQRQSENGTPYADETMELPIFKELESAWFTTTNSPTSGPPANAPSSPAPAPAAKSSVMPNEDLLTTQRFSTAEPTRPAPVPQQAGPSEAQEGNRLPSRNGSSLDRDRDTASVGAGVSSSNGSSSNGAAPGSNGSNPWQTAADEGWQAARAASEAPVETTTTAGLPKRTPMAQLVPGGVDRGGNSVQRRTPEAVRGLLSAYHRGVARGRQSTNPEETSGGQQSSQAGKEHEA